MPPLMTPEQALRLGELQDHGEAEALVERARRARVAGFRDDTDGGRSRDDDANRGRDGEPDQDSAA